MSKNLIGFIFIVAGVGYSSLAIDVVYKYTLGWLVLHEWVKPPKPVKDDLKNILGRKPTILLYSLILIIIGVYILWNKNS